MSDPRLKEPEKPVFQMSPAERLVEGLRRRAVLFKKFEGDGVRTRVEDMTLIAETSLNNYFIDVGGDDPRFIKIQTIYELDRVTDRERDIAARVTSQSFGAKVIVEPYKVKYRLRFVAEVFAVNLSYFAGSIGIYQALIEDCRERFLRQIGNKST